MKIVKHSGDIVEFNSEKLKKSLLKSGATATVVDALLHAIKKEMY